MKYPLVSCVVVSNRPKNKESILSIITNQTYKSIELIYHDTSNSSLTLGEERNIAVSKCNGDYIAVFDDDDYSAPDRILTQMKWLHDHNADACALSRVTLKSKEKEDISFWRQFWEGTLVCRREILEALPYKKLNKGEDGNVNWIWKNYSIVSLDMPHLYIYNQHDSNVSGQDHWDRLWIRATTANDMIHGRV